ncbi:hypothetical protein K502DRAFT_350692 [Neoconidiobolus thromboides FSU 785]|nr:hypothetical protein K502DRAFT_350692 [Neoconidiobolus thromboides FSU 785]
MSSILQISTSLINLAAAFVLICHGFNNWVLSAQMYNNPVFAIGGIYCNAFAAFLLAYEFKDLEGFYHKYCLFFLHPIGRASLYILFSLITFSIAWYGILSFILLLAFAATSVIIYFTTPEFGFSPLIPNFTNRSNGVEKNITHSASSPSHIEAQPVSMPEPTVPH